MKMMAAYSSEPFPYNKKNMWHNNPEDYNLNSYIAH
jgi:hypothetical protein